MRKTYYPQSQCLVISSHFHFGAYVVACYFGLLASPGTRFLELSTEAGDFLDKIPARYPQTHIKSPPKP